MQYQGIEEQKIVNRGLLPLARELNLPLVATNDVHYLRQGDYQPHDILLCIGTGKTVNDAQRLRYTGDQFFLKTAEQMAAVFDGPSRRAEEHAAHRRALQRHDPEGAEPPAVVRRARGLHARSVLRARRARRVRAAAAAPAAARGGRPAAPHDRRVRASSRLRDRDDQEDGVPGLLPDRLGLHPLRARGGHSGRPGPRLGRRVARRLVHAHHRRRSDRLRPASSSASSTPSACRCPTSTSTSASGGAAR